MGFKKMDSHHKPHDHETFEKFSFCHFDRRENSCKPLINNKIVTSLRSSQ